MNAPVSHSVRPPIRIAHPPADGRGGRALRGAKRVMATPALRTSRIRKRSPGATARRACRRTGGAAAKWPLLDAAPTAPRASHPPAAAAATGDGRRAAVHVGRDHRGFYATLRWRRAAPPAGRLAGGFLHQRRNHRERKSGSGQLWRISHFCAFLANDAGSRKCFGPACTPAFLRMTSRPWRCRTGPYVSMLPGVAG